MLRSITRVCACALFVLMAGSRAQAALIAFGAAQDIAGDSDVSTNGSLVAAFNFGGTGVPGTTINGVNFQSFAVDGSANSFTVGNYTFSSTDPINPAATTTVQVLSAQYQAMLTSAATLRADRLFTLTMSGLTIGKTYEFQTWVNNSNRQNGPNFLFQTTVSDGTNSVDLYAGDDGSTRQIPPVPGQYVIGTFTANATSQQVFYSNGEIDGWVNGFQLRELGAAPPSGPAVPLPPAVWVGLALGAIALALRGRQMSPAIR